MKVGVIGRGALGLTCAYELVKSGSAEVTVIGSRTNSYTASRAAGAMLNIVSEVDVFNATHPLTQWKLANKKTVLNLWEDLIKSLVDDRAIPQSLLFGRGTQIIIDRNTGNSVEESSFEAMRVCHNHEVHHDESANKDTDSSTIDIDGFLIDDEKSVDSRAFLEGLEKYLDIFASNVNSDVVRILKYGDQLCLETADGKNYRFDKIVLCAGSWTQSIIERSPHLPNPSRQSFYGVGSALLVTSELEYVAPPTVDRILRTPNRGGTCGIHAVQRMDSLYVGASSVISNMQLKTARASSALALFEGLKDTLGFDIYQLSARIITGYRPVTDDSVPIIGNLCSGVFCCYGTKRDGFTWAPFFAKHITKSVLDESYSSPQWDDLLDQCCPQRRLVSAGDVDLCIENYVTNKICESHQHGKNLDTQDIEQLYSIASAVHAYVKDKGNSVGVQPELVNMFYYVIMDKE